MSYEDTLVDQCDIYRDRGHSKGKRGGPKSEWELVAGGVDCRKVPRQGWERDETGKRTMHVRYEVFLDSETRLDDTNQLRFVDEATGAVHILAVHDAYDPTGFGILYMAVCEEVAT